MTWNSFAVEFDFYGVDFGLLWCETDKTLAST